MAGALFVVCVPTAEHQTQLVSCQLESECVVDKPNQTPLPGEAVATDAPMPGRRAALLKQRLVRSSSSGDVGRLQHEVKSEEILSDLARQNEDYRLRMPLEKLLEEALTLLKIQNAVWNTGKDNKYHQVSFCVASGEPCEETLRCLGEYGIGQKLSSVVSVIPCALYYRGSEGPFSPQGIGNLDYPLAQKQSADMNHSAWGKFCQSMRTRLMVAQVVEGVKGQATLTFDFIVLLIIAALTAALGLVENSTVILVASMLISPLMGPIMAGMFGTVIKDRRLQNIGVSNELLGLSLCVLIGFLFGLTIGIIDDQWGSEEWPTQEMLSRGELRSLWVGVLIALPSGAAVAIAILGDNTGSIIGVAISAALLPPAVNAGLMWSMSLVTFLLGSDAPDVFSGSYVHIWSERTDLELAVLAAISLSLTLVNIVCIFVAGILVLKIKEVTPRGPIGQSRNSWKQTLKIARDYSSMSPAEASSLNHRLADDMLQGFDFPADTNDDYESRRRFGTQRHLSVPAHNQYTWSPASNHGVGRQEFASLMHQVTTARGPGLMAPQQHSSWRHGVGSNLLRLWTPVGSSPPYAPLDQESPKSHLCSIRESWPPKPHAEDQAPGRFLVTPASDP